MSETQNEIKIQITPTLTTRLVAVQKRSGETVPFDAKKIYEAIKKAVNVTDEISDVEIVKIEGSVENVILHRVGEAAKFGNDQGTFSPLAFDGFEIDVSAVHVRLSTLEPARRRINKARIVQFLQQMVRLRAFKLSPSFVENCP